MLTYPADNKKVKTKVKYEQSFTIANFIDDHLSTCNCSLVLQAEHAQTIV